MDYELLTIKKLQYCKVDNGTKILPEFRICPVFKETFDVCK